MTDASDRLRVSLADRYRLERELGQGGMALALAAESRGSADVTEVTRGARMIVGEVASATPAEPSL